jgi:hypothetical protein
MCNGMLVIPGLLSCKDGSMQQLAAACMLGAEEVKIAATASSSETRSLCCSRGARTVHISNIAPPAFSAIGAEEHNVACRREKGTASVADRRHGVHP